VVDHPPAAFVKQKKAKKLITGSALLIRVHDLRKP